MEPNKIKGGIFMKKYTINMKGTLYQMEEGSNYLDLLREYPEQPDLILAVKVDNELHSLRYQIRENCKATWVTFYDLDGKHIYSRSIKLLLIMAMKEICPEVRYTIGNKINGNFYIEMEQKLTVKQIAKVKEKMQQFVQMELEIIKEKVSHRGLEIAYRKFGYEEELENYQIDIRDTYSLYKVKGTYYPYLYGRVACNTRVLTQFDLQPFQKNNMILILPQENNFERLNPIRSIPVLLEVFQNINSCHELLGIKNVAKLNREILKEKLKELILSVDQEQNDRMYEIVKDLLSKPRKIVLITGPSSSGKTTFSQQLEIKLKARGKNTRVISLDHFFKNACDSPLNEKGEKDYESIHHFDVDFFQKLMKQLLKGEEISVPTYNFKKNGGEREFNGETMKLEEKDVLILEGIHALNPLLSSFIDSDLVYKIYVAPLVTLGFDRYTKTSSNDVRLLRRMIRDYQTRNMSPEATFAAWHKVRKGEQQNITPYIEEANSIYNTFTVYEVGVLKIYSENLLLTIKRSSPYYSEARRLYKMLQNYIPIYTNLLSSTGFIREFIGGGCYYR